MLLGLGAVASDSARAGCGHFVVSHSGRSGMDALTDLELLTNSNAVPLAPGRGLPCSGPGCSEGPGLPYVPAPLPPVRSEPWCPTTFEPPSNGPDFSAGPYDPTPSRPRHVPVAIERPPRPADGPLTSPS